MYFLNKRANIFLCRTWFEPGIMREGPVPYQVSWYNSNQSIFYPDKRPILLFRGCPGQPVDFTYIFRCGHLSDDSIYQSENSKNWANMLMYLWFNFISSACNCFGPGSESFECNQRNGQCDCLPFVKGRDCSYCRNRYWNIKSGRGCEPCDCDNVGTVQPDCDEDSGQCECKPGVGGQTCDRCLFDHHGFSAEGCTREYNAGWIR